VSHTKQPNSGRSGRDDSFKDSTEGGLDAFATVASDLSLNLMAVVMIAASSLVAEPAMRLGPLDVKPGRTSQAATGQGHDRPIRVGITAAGEVDFEGNVLGPSRLLPVRQRLAAQIRQAMSQHPGAESCVQIIPDHKAPWQAILDVHGTVQAVTDNFQTVARG
jgi:hypothetical protein